VCGCRLAVLAMKKKWEEKCKRENKPFDKPNIVYGANVQVCWEKVGFLYCNQLFV